MKTERFGSLVRVTAEAPVGFIWIAGAVHELVAEGRGGREATVDAQRDVRGRMALGVEKCEDVNCDWCGEK
jgi:hypothetical protein